MLQSDLLSRVGFVVGRERRLRLLDRNGIVSLWAPAAEDKRLAGRVRIARRARHSNQRSALASELEQSLGAIRRVGDDVDHHFGLAYRGAQVGVAIAVENYEADVE